MGRQRRFEDNFWVQDINSSAGFDALSQRMREGRKLCKDLDDYFKQRSKIEAQYSKDLLKLNKDYSKEENLSGLENSWKELKMQTENIANVHDLAAKNYHRLSQEMYTFNYEQKKVTKDLEDRVSKLHSAAKSTYAKVVNQQKTYNAKYEENSQAQNSVAYNERHSQQVSPKEMEKIRSKADKAKDDLEKADILYQNLVQQVQAEMAAWESEMTVLCKTFQELDEKRIDHCRDYLWQCSNIDSQANVDHDQCCEIVRVALEKCDIDKDIDFFLDRHKIGNVHPSRVEYEGHSRSFLSSQSSYPTKEGRPLPKIPKGSHIYSDVE